MAKKKAVQTPVKKVDKVDLLYKYLKEQVDILKLGGNAFEAYPKEE